MRVDLFASDTLRIESRKLSRPFDTHRLDELEKAQDNPKPAIIIGPARELAAFHPNLLKPFAKSGVRVVVTEAMPGTPMPRFDKNLIHCTLPNLDEKDEWRLLLAFINNAYDLLVLQAQNARIQSDLEELTRIGVLLSSEKDTDKLLELILTKSRMITNCDAGSLYLVQERDGQKRMLFKMAQNDSIPLNLKEMPIPLNKQSLAGYAILTGEPLVIDNAYEIDKNQPFTHARWIDKQIGYRNITMLTVPLKNLKGEVVGALQLLNRKRDPRIRLIDPLTAMVTVQTFDKHAIELVSSLASLAAVTLEKNMLYESIQNLFEGFVKASVKAIESRDPTTSGHSERVAILCVGLADQINHIDSGPLANLHFSQEELRELRYAALLHDFGKVGVRENVLVKAKKLYPGQEQELQMRAMFLRAAIRAEHLQKQLEFIERNGIEQFNGQRDDILEELRQIEATLEADLELVWEANEPKVLAEGNFDKLQSISERVYTRFNGDPLKLVTPEEIKVLSIPRGTLTEEERVDIESHVTHTYNFLMNIPWTKELRNVPDIAYKHHEKLNGRGYPRKLTAPQIPVQSRIMAICDIFDALTASDRPYKKAVPFDRALKILGFERKDGMLDPMLLDVFVDYKVYELVKEG